MCVVCVCGRDTHFPLIDEMLQCVCVCNMRVCVCGRDAYHPTTLSVLLTRCCKDDICFTNSIFTATCVRKIAAINAVQANPASVPRHQSRYEVQHSSF